YNNYTYSKILICFILFELMNLIIVTSYYNIPKSLLGFQISNTSLKSVFAIEGILLQRYTFRLLVFVGFGKRLLARKLSINKSPSSHFPSPLKHSSYLRKEIP